MTQDAGRHGPNADRSSVPRHLETGGVGSPYLSFPAFVHTSVPFKTDLSKPSSSLALAKLDRPRPTAARAPIDHEGLADERGTATSTSKDADHEANRPDRCDRGIRSRRSPRPMTGRVARAARPPRLVGEGR
jgi:hypothetical protein